MKQSSVKEDWADSLEILEMEGDKVLPIHDIKDIREKVINRVKSELNLRITKRYININLSLVEKLVDISLKELKII